MATGALMLTIILAAMMYAALFMALEYQENISSEVEISPRGPLASMMDTMLAAMVVETFIVLQPPPPEAKIPANQTL